MKIRSITCFLNPEWPLARPKLKRAADFIASARQALVSSGYEVQSTRLATIPFTKLVPDLDAGSIVRLATELEDQAASYGIGYVSIGPADPAGLEAYKALPAVIAATRNVFTAGIMTTPGGGVSLPAVRLCAEVIHQSSAISADGFANLRFAALANVPPGMPFFPAGYAGDDRPGFALALEAADLAVEAAAHASSLGELRRSLIASIEGHAARLTTACLALEREGGVKFNGLDFSFAPYPQEERSLGAALERMGVPAAGLHGSLAGMAYLADSLDRAEFRRAGFNGLFTPVLEDAVLARRLAEGRLSSKDLLLYSAVCGTGLDTLPLPGDVSVEQIYALLLDLAALALRLDKRLTARLLPIPGKQAGDHTGFDFEFFANTRVMPLEARPLEGLLAGEEDLFLKPRWMAS